MGRYAGIPGNIIEDLELIEVSLVKNPAMEQAKVAVIKSFPEQQETETEAADAVEKEEKPDDVVAREGEVVYDNNHEEVKEEQVPQEETKTAVEVTETETAKDESEVSEKKEQEVKSFAPEVVYVSLEGEIYTKSSPSQVIELAKRLDLLQLKEYKLDLKGLPVNDEDLTIVAKACASNKGLADILKKMASAIAGIDKTVGSPESEDLPVQSSVKRSPVVEAFSGLCVKRAAEMGKNLQDPKQASEVIMSLSRMEGGLSSEDKKVVQAYKSYALLAPREVQEKK